MKKKNVKTKIQNKSCEIESPTGSHEPVTIVITAFALLRNFINNYMKILIVHTNWRNTNQTHESEWGIKKHTQLLEIHLCMMALTTAHYNRIRLAVWKWGAKVFVDRNKRAANPRVCVWWCFIAVVCARHNLTFQINNELSLFFHSDSLHFASFRFHFHLYYSFSTSRF